MKRPISDYRKRRRLHRWHASLVPSFKFGTGSLFIGPSYIGELSDVIVNLRPESREAVKLPSTTEVTGSMEIVEVGEGFIDLMRSTGHEVGEA